MNKRQKIFVIGVILVVIASVVATAYYSILEKEREVDKLKVVATFYPLAFFAQQIGGEEVNVKQLIPDNTEVHSWQPSFDDILAVDEAEVIIYNGASLDRWFEEDILPIIDSSDKAIIETSERVNLLETEQENDGHEHDHGGHDSVHRQVPDASHQDRDVK